MLRVESGAPIWAIGVMTGTSGDGVDLALLRSDGETIFGFGPTLGLAASDRMRALVDAACAGAAGAEPEALRHPSTWPADFRAQDGAIAEWLSWAIDGFALELGPAAQGPGDSAPPKPHPPTAWAALLAMPGQGVIGVHGQTVLHRPDIGLTLQLGLSERLRPARFQLPLVTDFRQADMAAGGEGAPLAPFFHHACARWAGLSEPVAFLNIGGVANVTWLDPAIADPVEACMAFDTGPGNALIDDWMQARTGAAIDRDGATAALGRAQPLRSNAARAFLARTPPKSLDRNEFAGVLAQAEGLSTEDGAATLTRFTVDCIVAAQAHMPSPPSRWLVCGGGRLNTTLMRMLGEALDAPVEPVETVGLDGDFLEAQAFAYLAVRVLRGLPTSAPRTTGCSHPVCGGRISRPEA